MSSLPASVKAALAIGVLIVGYFGISAILRNGDADTADAADQQADDRFAVVVRTIAPEPLADKLVVRGRAEADRKVTVRAETAGIVADTPVAEGTRVEKSTVLCRLNVDARAASLAESEAALRKAQLDFNAASKLAAEGFRSESSLASFRAALDLAKANMERSRLELARTEIRAPFAGIFDSRAVESGDFLNAGDPCGVLLEPSSYVVKGAVSEKDIGRIAVGDSGTARLATGETRDGTVRFIASAADSATRTFDVELVVDNSDGALRDGVTAEFDVITQAKSAHLAPRSALVLDDEGRIGVRHVTASDDDDGAIVAFTPVTLIGEDTRGVWITGLDGTIDLITRGQDFVSAGQVVTTVRNQDNVTTRADARVGGIQ